MTEEFKFLIGFAVGYGVVGPVLSLGVMWAWDKWRAR